ncbi:hypothetical protein PAXRUDRAFT_826244 [Paxillus rubicundulus Ve08.2h10]|uniref:Uncharacterized protein n=1 Tax=Paxillus rubicundulus Ve08.2h10 TaxID=930991 RepID=A0A0D0DS67_9AGAM|nr:hypothetical protein PAXRUDRAFT_826244 [Paxillus rubicundulus Ve08.2h10]
MSGSFSKLNKGCGQAARGQPTEQRFSILPHPAKSNNPADLTDSGPGFNGNPGFQACRARDPHVPSQEILNKLEVPLSREELRKRAEELNKK